MKLHSKNGELRTEYGVFLPRLTLSEYEVEDSSFTTQIIEKTHDGVFENYLPKGKYAKVTADVRVTRYYPL